METQPTITLQANSTDEHGGIQFVDTIRNIGTQIGTHWQYLENDIPKADWDIYKKAMENENAMIDTQLAICDLYEMITGGASNG